MDKKTVASVTASVDRVDFYNPINIGDLVTFYASVNLVGKTSMEVGVKVIAENILKGIKIHANTLYFTMVALDENARPTEVPELLLETGEHERRNTEAQHRRKQRLDQGFKKNSK